MPIPFVDLAIAGIAAAGSALAGGSQEGTEIVGRPSVAFSAQDQVRKAISEQLKRAQAMQGAPIALPNIDVASLGGMVNIPGLDVPLGINPQIAGLGTADFFSTINANRALSSFNPIRATASDEEPPGQQAGERERERDRFADEMGGDPGRIADLGTPGNPRTGERTVLQHVDSQQDTLDLIGRAIQELLERTDVSQTEPSHFNVRTLQNT